jgi:hypothetical protein
MTSYAMDNNVYTECTTTTAHSFSKGDVVLLSDINNSNQFSGYYIVKEITSSTQFVIDLDYTYPLVNNAFISRVIKYSMPPDIDAQAKINLANTIKDFLTQNLTDTNEIFPAPNTVFNYDLLCGSEYKYIYDFDYYTKSGGFVQFVNSGLTATTECQLSIGDSINVAQDLYAWNYTDNFFSSGLVGFTGSTQHYYGISTSVSWQVNVTGQITHPSYNGIVNINPINNTSLVTDKGWISSTGVEGGKIYGTPFPQYNSIAIVTNITYVPGTGVIVTTNLLDDEMGGQTTINISGKIRLTDDTKTVVVNDLSLTGFTAYNARFNNFDYSISAMDKYVIQSRANNLNYISTILDVEASAKRYRIEKDTKSWLLFHTLPGVSNAAFFQFYDSNNNILGNLRIENNTSNATDFYVPVGIDQIIACTGKTEVIGSITGYSDNIAYYHVNASFNNTMRSNRVYFELNDDCSSYDLNHIMWKDSLGSWLSMPFKYISRNNIEAERKNYYQSEGKWDNNTFGYDSYGRGEKQYYGRSRKSVIVNSGWLEQFEVDLIEDMFESPSLYLQLPDGTLVAGRIDEKSIELYKNQNNDLIQYQFNFIYSSNNYRL